MLTSVKLKQEIIERLGFFPAFLSTALETPVILNSFLQSTKSLYLNNPLPASFKEKLFVYLSNCCEISYFTICHSCQLRSLGVTAREILALNQLEVLYRNSNLTEDLEFLAARKNDVWDEDPAIEKCVLRCGAAIFLNFSQKTACCRQLKESLGAIAYKHFIALLSYIKLCHQWLEGHPDVSYEQDRRAQLHLAPLLLEEIGLAEIFQNERVTTKSVDTIAVPTAENFPKNNIYWERFQRYFIESPFPMAIWDREGKIIRVNQNWIDITGYSNTDLSTLEEWTNKAQVRQQDSSHSHQLGWETEIGFQQVINALIDLPYSSPISIDCQPAIANATCSEVTIVTKNGERRLWDLYSASLNNIDLDIELTLSIAKDVTNFILKEAELTELESKLDLILEATSAGNWEWNPHDDRVLLCSHARQLLNIDKFDNTYQGFLSAIHPQERELFNLAAMGAVTTQSNLDLKYPVINPDNSIRWLRTKAKLIRDSKGQVLRFTGMIFDVTSNKNLPDPIESQAVDRKRQLEVTQSLDEDELVKILNLIPYYLLVVNIETERITFCNRELALCLGFSDARQVCDKTIPQCFSPENAQRIAQQYRQVLRAGETLSIQESIVLQNGKHYFDTTITPLKNQNGKFYALLHTYSELPSLVVKTQEALSQRTAQLEAANKELESFSYSVSHDLQAPLRVINGFSQVIWDNYNELLDDLGKHYLQRIQANSERMSESIDALLQLSKVTRIQMNLGYVNLSEIVREIASELVANHPRRKVRFKIADKIQVKGDPMLLRIMLSNLLDNAWKYTSKTEFAQIEFGSIVDTDRQFAYFVRDNGAGFDPEYASKLFKAFQRLHSEAEFPGMGIGLATVKRIIYRHGGKIWATGKCDRGASFYFTL
jgi:signal transduction histidine kinase